MRKATKAEIKCPVCEGKGSIPGPIHQAITNTIAAHLLRTAGYSIREIMKFLKYKSPRSVAILLEKER